MKRRPSAAGSSKASDDCLEIFVRELSALAVSAKRVAALGERKLAVAVDGLDGHTGDGVTRVITLMNSIEESVRVIRRKLMK
jgi:hypothetical protein